MILEEGKNHMHKVIRNYKIDGRKCLAGVAD